MCFCATRHLSTNRHDVAFGRAVCHFEFRFSSAPGAVGLVDISDPVHKPPDKPINLCPGYKKRTGPSAKYYHPEDDALEDRYR